MGGSLKTKNGDSGPVIETFNESATGAPTQLQIKHNYGDVDINNLRGALNLKAVATCETPTANAHIANKAYVDSAVSNGVAGVGETDTLASVTARGASTSVTSTFSGGINVGDLSNGGITGSNYNITGVNNITINDPGEGITWGGGANTVTLYNIDDANDNIMNFMNAAEVRVNNSTLATQSYVNTQVTGLATESYVTTQINNLINGAPAALDTLNELAAAIGDNANYAASVTTAVAAKVSKSGDTMTGKLNFSSSNSHPIYIHNTNNGGAAGIEFCDTETSGSQLGYFEYKHQDSASNGLANSFHFRSNQPSLAIIAPSTGNYYVGTNKVFHDGYHPNADTADTATYATSAGNADTVDGFHRDPRYGVGKQTDFTVNGDANTYYPVLLSFNPESTAYVTQFSIYRTYSETAPSTWNTASHKGGLQLDVSVRYGGWGGYTNDYTVNYFGEVYSTICAGMHYGPHTMSWVVYLRGGGASYHMRTPANIGVTVYDSSAGPHLVYDHSNNAYDVSLSARTNTNSVQAEIRDHLPIHADGTSINTGPVSPTFNTVNATGDVCAYVTSDVSLKENVASISNPLDKVMAIRGVEFDWNDNYVNTRGGVDGYFTRKHDVGVIAQEVETVMPEVVGTRDDGTKGVRYDKMVGLLIEAIKDQQQQIEQLKNIIEGK